MAVYKEEKTNTWRAVYRYTDWNGERKQTQKRGFKTKREAQAWEREQLNKTSADLDMTFKSFVDLYTADMKTRLKENTWATKDHIIRTKLLPYFGRLKMERYIRLRSLGKGYGEAEIREKILCPKIRQVYGKTQMQIPKRKLTGLQKLYYSYLYQMGVFPKKPKRIPYAVRSDIRRLDQRICQMEFLQKEEITTREELAAYRKPLEEQVLWLMKERRELYRKEPNGMRIQEINGELK